MSPVFHSASLDIRAGSRSLTGWLIFTVNLLLLDAVASERELFGRFA
jgi:hypothetical protein